MVNFLFLLLLLASCAKGQKADSLIVGSWQLVKMDTEAEEEIISIGGKKDKSTYSNSQIFFENGKVSSLTTEASVSYTIKGDTLYIADNSFLIHKISNDELILIEFSKMGKVYHYYERIKNKE